MKLTVIGADQALDMEMVNSQPAAPVPIGESVAVTWQVPMFKSADIPRKRSE